MKMGKYQEEYYTPENLEKGAEMEPVLPEVKRVGIPPNFDGDPRTLQNLCEPDTLMWNERQSEINEEIDRLWDEYERSEFNRLNGIKAKSPRRMTKEEVIEMMEADEEHWDNERQQKIAAAVNPSHYKCVFPASDVDYQWMHLQWWISRHEAQSLLEELGISPPSHYAVELVSKRIYQGKCRMQSHKYRTRFGKKDDTEQERQKADWYDHAATIPEDPSLYHANGMPKLPDEV